MNQFTEVKKKVGGWAKSTQNTGVIQQGRSLKKLQAKM